MKRFSQRGLCESFQAIACSRPPVPMSRIFMISRFLMLFKEANIAHNNKGIMKKLAGGEFSLFWFG
jgi:hypothetical protein